MKYRIRIETPDGTIYFKPVPDLAFWEGSGTLQWDPPFDFTKNEEEGLSFPSEEEAERVKKILCVRLCFQLGYEVVTEE